MIGWMAFSVVFALLVALSARAAEASARTYGRPVRGMWVGALLVSALVPVLMWLTGIRWPGVFSWLAGPSVMELPLVGDVGSGSAGAAPARGGVSFPVERFVQALWLALSAGALGWFCWAWRRLARARASWRPHVLRDQRVLLSTTSGPAVIGFYHPSIVVPRWVLTETASVQRMILLHEQEHAKSGDHVVLALAPLLLVAFPWNLPLWWQTKRLRLAIELDCDARVLRHGICPREYGTLLLELAGAHGSTAIAGASLVEPRTFLERRIIAMSSSPSRHRHVRAIAGLTGAVLLAVAACESTTAMAPKRAPEPAEASAQEQPAQKIAGLGPLIIVDGVNIGHHSNLKTPFERIDANSIEIIKGEAALARYGEAGREGVIIVTSRNRKGAPDDVLVVDKMKAREDKAEQWEIIADKIELRETAKKVSVDFQGTKLRDADVKLREKVQADVVELKPKSQRVESGTLEQSYVEVVDIKESALQRKDIKEQLKAPAADKLTLTVSKYSQRPLLFVDGVEVDHTDLHKIGPDLIDSIEVLKGSRALDSYGERGRHGVILIKTKGGN